MRDYKDMIRSAIETHISSLYWLAEEYKKNGNREAQMDCLNEVKKYEQLKEKITL